MPSPADPADPITQLGEVLATAEHHVQEIVAAAERRADERLRAAQQRLDARAAELNGIADELLTASALLHHQLQRLRALEPLDPHPVDAPPAPADPSPSPPRDRAPDPAPRPDPPADDAAHRPASRPWTPPASDPVDPPTTASEHGPTTNGGPPTSPAPGRAVPPQDDDLPLIDSSDAYEPGAPSAEQLDSARLVALSMAAGGRSRGEVEAHLRDELGITDYGPLIDYVFGISTPASVVPSWPPRRRRRGD